MSWSLNIGTIAGTAIRVHFTFLLFLAWIFISSYASGGADAAVSALVFILLVFACVTAHEFGHIFTARAFGVPTPDVTLLPIGGVARLARIPEKPSEEFLVAIAGPLVNVAIAIVLVLVAGADLSERHLATIDSSQVSMIDRLAAVNLFIAVFNMIPAFPMDGGRVLRAVLSIRLGHVRATEIAAKIGQLVAFALGFIGLFWNPMLIFIAIFVYLAAASESQFGHHPGDVARRAGERGDDHRVRDACARRWYRHRRADAVAHQPERVSGGRRRRPSARPARARRHHPRPQGARARLPASATS